MDGLAGPELEQRTQVTLPGPGSHVVQGGGLAWAGPKERPTPGQVAILAWARVPSLPPALISALSIRLEPGAERMGGGSCLFSCRGALIGENYRNIQSQLIPKGPVGTLFPRASASWALILLRTGNWNQRWEERKPPHQSNPSSRYTYPPYGSY